ncbi:MAG TPA: GDSL-type esterase/lipase family protein [Steroidobacteraceae bacterium]|jgi:lysophospholipase L1-like esterase|nr:GDSL-type esterase/lipase family protein [Steroidobacteraceae bacterium]
MSPAISPAITRVPVFLLLLWFVPFAAGAHSAVEPVQRDDPAPKERQELLNQRVAGAGKAAQVIFIGDSITQHWESDGKEVWAQYYARRDALNLGLSGDRTQHVLWRLDNGNLDGLDPKVIVLMIGTNNITEEATSVAHVADGVAAIVKKLRDRLPRARVLLLAILPREENPGPRRGNILQVNQIIRRLADEQHVFWLDFGYRFVASDGTISRDVMHDYLHLTPQGYQIWAAAMEDELAVLLHDSHPGRASGRE